MPITSVRGPSPSRRDTGSGIARPLSTRELSSRWTALFGWKLVRRHGRPWELYAIEGDRAEAHDLAADHPEVVAELSTRYDAWADRCGVLPRETVLDLYARRGKGPPPE